MRSRLLAPVAAAAALALSLSSCSDDSGTTSGPEPSASADGSAPASPDGAPPSESPSPKSAPSGSSRLTEPSPSGAVEPTPATGDLSWRKVRTAPNVQVIVGGGWTGTTNAAGTEATFRGERTVRVQAPRRSTFSEVLTDGRYGVAVAQDKQEQRGNTVTVLDLSRDRKTTLGPDNQVPPAPGGSYALGEGRLYYPTYQGQKYCLAEAEVSTGTAKVAWCAPPRTGFSDLDVTPRGVSLLHFDSGRISCRTPSLYADGDVTPLPGPTRCKGWDSLDTPLGAIWGEVPKERMTETSQFYARVDGRKVSLGQGVTRTLTWCGGAAYWAKDPVTDGGRGRLMRWDGGSKARSVYATPAPGPGIVSAPECGGDSLTVTGESSSGTEVVSARVR